MVVARSSRRFARSREGRDSVNVSFDLNGRPVSAAVPASTTLLAALREHLGVFGVKHGCETGECGACTVLLDGRPVNSCVMLAAQAADRRLETIEGFGQHPELGWRRTAGLNPLQAAFVETGAIQCGYCTPAMLLTAQALLRANSTPSEAEVREAFSGVLCRCTGYLKPVQAVLRAAAVLRGEALEPIGAPIPAPPELFGTTGGDGDEPAGPLGGSELTTRTRVMPRITVVPETETLRMVGKPAPKVDAVKLAQGKPAFAADTEMRGMLTAKLLKSPLSHARLRRIDASRARQLPGVAAVLT